MLTNLYRHTYAIYCGKCRLTFHAWKSNVQEIRIQFRKKKKDRKIYIEQFFNNPFRPTIYKYSGCNTEGGREK